MRRVHVSRGTCRFQLVLPRGACQVVEGHGITNFGKIGVSISVYVPAYARRLRAARTTHTAPAATSTPSTARITCACARKKLPEWLITSGP